MTLLEVFEIAIGAWASGLVAGLIFGALYNVWSNFFST